jgi:hypothetical protein
MRLRVSVWGREDGEREGEEVLLTLQHIWKQREVKRYLCLRD